MIRWLGLWRLVLGRLRSDWPFLLALWLLIVSATTLLAAGALYAETVEIGGLRRALAEAAAHERGVSVRFSASPDELAQTEPRLRTALETAFTPVEAEARLTLRSPSLRLVPTQEQPREEEPPEQRLTLLGAYEGLDEHASLRSGRWPVAGRQPLEVVVSDAAATALDLREGSRQPLADASTPGADPDDVVLEVVVVGTFEAEPGDPYWLGDALDLSGAEARGQSLFRGPLLAAREDLTSAGRFAALDVRCRALLRVEGMRVEQLDAVRSSIGRLPGQVETALPAGRFLTVERSLSDVLSRIDRSSLVSRSGVVLITLQFAVLAGYAVLLVGGVLAERRRPEVALLRARGASTAEVGLIAAGEAVALSMPAVLVAPWLSLALVNAVGGWGPIAESGIIAATEVGTTTLVVAALAGLACTAALTVPALLAEIDLARVRAALGRPLSQTLAQRLGLDLLLLVLAAIGIVQLQTYGAALTERTTGGLELDPLLVAAPAIALAAGAVLVVRLVPRLGELAERLLRRQRGVLLSVGTRQIARRPLRYTRSALLIVLAGALGTFGAMYGATWSQSQIDQAAYQAAADVRVLLGGQQAADREETGAALRALGGVEAATPLIRVPFDVGRAVRQAELLAVQPETLREVVEGTAAEAGLHLPLERLAEARRQPVGVELPPGSRRLAITLDAALTALINNPNFPLVPGEWPGIQLSPWLSDGRTPATLEPQAAFFSGANQRLVFDVAELAAGTEEALLLQGLLIEISTPSNAAGEVRLLALESSPSEAGDADWQMLARPAQLEAWLMERLTGSVTAEGTEAGARLVFDRAHPLLPSFEGAAQYRWAPIEADVPLAAFASGSLLSGSGTSVGDTLEIDYQFQTVSLQIAGRLADFPAHDPALPFAVVDADSLNRVRFELQLGAAQPDEWWLSAADGSLDAIAEAARAEPIRAQEVITRAELTRTLLRDPIALGLVGALLLGSLAAAAFAVVGLLVNAVVSAREQLAELALLRAMGASGRQVLGWLTLEHGFVLAVGAMAGAGVGWLIGVLVLPHAPLNRSGAPVVPAPQIIVPADIVALVGLAAVVVVVLGVLVARREVGRRPLVEVLREGDG